MTRAIAIALVLLVATGGDGARKPRATRDDEQTSAITR
jgi:hypothetical protein